MTRLPLPHRILLGLALVIATVGIHDARVATNRQWTTRSAVGAIEQYRRFVSPRLRGVVQCRFKLSCSAYGLESVKKHGAVRGGWRTVKRIARCNPWTPAGTIDLP